MAIFKNEWKEAFLEQQMEIRQLREALRRTENRLVIATASASKLLLEYGGFDGAQRFHNLVKEREEHELLKNDCDEKSQKIIEDNNNKLLDAVNGVTNPTLGELVEPATRAILAAIKEETVKARIDELNLSKISPKFKIEDRIDKLQAERNQQWDTN